MPDHKIATREEWQAARDELAKLEAEHAQLSQKVTEQRRRLPWVPVEKEYEFDFGLALTPEQAQEIPEVKEMIDNPPEWLQDWGRQVGAKLEDGLREGPSFIAFARENGSVYHTYTVMAPDPFVAPYHAFLLQRTPKEPPEQVLAWRKDEYPDAAYSPT